jgi:prepilin-type N-terminal cleavage/methylation domain-containing protein
MKNQKGMSLIEILIVIALMAIIVTTMGKNIMGRFRSGKIKTTKIKITKLLDAVKEFEMTCSSSLPEGQDSLQWLVSKPTDLKCPEYPEGGFILVSDLKDAFDKEMIYRRENGMPVIISVGLSNGDADSADAISSADLAK